MNLMKTVSQHTPVSGNNQEHYSPPVTHGDEYLLTDVTLLALHSSQGQQSSTHWQAQSQTTLTKTGENKPTITIPILKDFFSFSPFPFKWHGGFLPPREAIAAAINCIHSIGNRFIQLLPHTQ